MVLREGYLKRVARRQEVRHDARLPVQWLQAALSRYQNQRIQCSVGWREDGKLTEISAIYWGVHKQPPDRFRLAVRKAYFDGERRRYGMLLVIPLADVVRTPKGCPFWRALYKQLVAVKLKEAVIQSGGGGR